MNTGVPSSLSVVDFIISIIASRPPMSGEVLCHISTLLFFFVPFLIRNEMFQ